jgi:hypothetical protein
LTGLGVPCAFAPVPGRAAYHIAMRLVGVETAR